MHAGRAQPQQVEYLLLEIWVSQLVGLEMGDRSKEQVELFGPDRYPASRDVATSPHGQP